MGPRHHTFVLLLALVILLGSTRGADPPLATKTTGKARSPTATTKGPAAPTPTPTLIVPPQCKDCFGPGNTSNMTCYKNTQCVPLQYLCDSSASPCTDIDDDQDSDGPILCQDQLCVPVNFLPLPSPGSGKMSQNSSSDCLSGSYYSLFGSTPKYTQSCVEPYPSAPADCEPWEYLAQSSCFLSTCGPNLDCEPPFNCQKIDPSDIYGICANANGTSGDMGNGGDSDGGLTSQYSSREYLVQGLLIGICSLALGIGLGVGFWHYKRKQLTARGTGSRTIDESSTWLFQLLLCGRAKAQDTANSAEDPALDPPSALDTRNSLVESESLEGSLASAGRPRSSVMFSGRWRWDQRSSTMPRTVIFPEMEPPPLYHNGPELPTYGDSTDVIVLDDVRVGHPSSSRPTSASTVLDLPPLNVVVPSGTVEAHAGPASPPMMNRDLSGPQRPSTSTPDQAPVHKS